MNNDPWRWYFGLLKNCLVLSDILHCSRGNAKFISPNQKGTLHQITEKFYSTLMQVSSLEKLLVLIQIKMIPRYSDVIFIFTRRPF